MSTGLECEYIEILPGKWYYILDQGSPRDAWDWREYAAATGPFATMDAAYTHLQKNNANPGGYSEMPYDEAYKPDDVMRKLITEAHDPARRRGY